MKDLNKLEYTSKIFMNFFQRKFETFEKELKEKSGGTIEMNNTVEDSFIINMVNATYENTPRVFFDILDEYDFTITIEAKNNTEYGFNIHSNNEVIYHQTINTTTRLKIEQEAVHVAATLLNHKLKLTSNETPNNK